MGPGPAGWRGAPSLAADWAAVESLFAVEHEALKHADRWPDAWDEAYAEPVTPAKAPKAVCFALWETVT